MATADKLTGVVLLLFALAAPSAAAIPEDGIRVEFQDAVAARQLTGLRYDVSNSGALLPRERRMSKYELFVDGAPDFYVAQSVRGYSRGATEFRILAGVRDPGKATLSAVATMLQRLRRLAAENVPEGCHVEIVVFPISDTAKTGKPDEWRSD